MTTWAYLHGCSLPGRSGGWAVVFRVGARSYVRAGCATDADAPRMQATAALMAVRHAPAGPLILHSPSKYVVDNLPRLHGWRRDGRLDSRHPKAVRNPDVWGHLEALLRSRIAWVRAELITKNADLDHNRARGLARYRAEYC